MCIFEVTMLTDVVVGSNTLRLICPQLLQLVAAEFATAEVFRGPTPS